VSKLENRQDELCRKNNPAGNDAADTKRTPLVTDRHHKTMLSAVRVTPGDVQADYVGAWRDSHARWARHF